MTTEQLEKAKAFLGKSWAAFKDLGSWIIWFMSFAFNGLLVYALSRERAVNDILYAEFKSQLEGELVDRREIYDQCIGRLEDHQKQCLSTISEAEVTFREHSELSAQLIASQDSILLLKNQEIDLLKATCTPKKVGTHPQEVPMPFPPQPRSPP